MKAGLLVTHPGSPDFFCSNGSTKLLPQTIFHQVCCIMIQDTCISVAMCEVHPFLMSCPANLASSPPKEGGREAGRVGQNAMEEEEFIF